MHTAIGCSLFSDVYSSPPRHVVDLVKLPPSSDTSTAEVNMAKGVHTTKEAVRKQLESMGMKNKIKADRHRKQETFNEGDKVMVILRKETFPIDTLGSCNLGNMVLSKS